MWHRILTFGAEGTETGNFCRPWGVAIARYSDLSTLSDPWSHNDEESSANSGSSSETFADWSRTVGVGFCDTTYSKHHQLINPTIGTNNNIRSSSSTSPNWSCYVIGVADRSNNRIQLFKFDAIRQTVTFLNSFGDGPGARHGQFDRPAGIVFNSKLEQILVADKDNHRVQVFDMSGSYLFKFGELGSKCGQFCYPWDIDVCLTTHNIIVSDTRNRRVQMFNNLGRYITHFNQPIDSPRGVVYLTTLQFMVSDFNKHRLVLITQSEDKSVTSSTSLMSTLVATNENNYLNNHFNNPPQKSARQITNHESKFVGFGEGSSWGEFLRPQGITSYGSTVYCADSRNNRVACWNKETQAFNYISRDVVELDRPAGLAAIDNYIVIVDFGNNRVHICQRLSPIASYPFDTQVQSKIETCTWRRVVTFGAEGTETGNFCRPWGVAIARYSDLSTLSDPWSNNDKESNANSANSSEAFADWSRTVGVGFCDTTFGKLPVNPTVGSNNNWANASASPNWSCYIIGVADRSNNRIQLFKFDAIRQTVTFLNSFGDGPGARHGQFNRPAGIVFNSKLEQILVADKDNHRVQVFDMSGSYLFKFGELGSKCGQFCYPWDIDVCMTTHNIIVSDTRNRRVQMFNNLGRYITHFNQPLDSPRGVVYSTPLQIMVSDFNKHRLVLVTQSDDKTVTSSTSLIPTKPENNYLKNHFNRSPRKPITRQINTINQFHESKFVGFGEGSSWGEFLRPQGATSYGSTVYCADSRNNRVACWNKETQTFNYISRDVVELDRPAGLAAIDNYIVIVDFGNNRVHICQRFPSINSYPFDTQVQSK